MPSLLDRAVNRLAGATDEPQRVQWRRHGRSYDFEVPGDNLFICVKDDLLLREYEWLGVSLDEERDVVIDGGAHVGTFSAMAAARSRRIVAVEPSPPNLRLLRRNLERNALTDVVSVEDGALWPTEGTVRLDLAGPSSSASVVRDEATTVEVRAITLDELVSAHGHLDLLKLDVEGAEFQLVQHTSIETLRRVRTIVGELHLWADPDGERGFASRLREAGFAVEIRTLPIHHVRESVGRIRRHAPDLEGHLRLKLTVAGVYGLTAVLDPIIGLRKRLDARDLRLFVAERP